MNRNLLFLLYGAAIFPMGCSLAPKYARPSAPVPPAWPAGAAYADAGTATNATDVQNLMWQDFFADEQLQRVIGTALTNSLDLRTASQKVELARALYGVQRAGLLPTVNVTGSESKSRVPASLSNTGSSHLSKEYSVNVGVLSWEPDFFGRIRNLKDRALEEYLATEQARHAAQILLVSSVANTYLALAADEESLKLAESTLSAQQDAYRLIKRRHDLGLLPELDLFRAQTQVDAASGDVALFKQRTAQDRNALNLLVGTPVPADLLPAQLGDAPALRDLDAGIPSEVLLRRPDVLQAESLLKAANADIGAARAAFFPSISLTASAGTSSSALSGLFKPGSGVWSYAPQITVPIFDARTWSAFKAAKVQREMAVTQYEKAIQTAFREVADALAVRGTVSQQVSAQESLVHAVSETYRLSTLRFDKGLDSYLSVLDAHRSLYSAQQGLVSLRLAKLANQVRLYSALGGGWQTEKPPQR